MAAAPTPTALGMTSGQSTSLAGLFSGIASSYASRAQGYLQQAGYAVQAQENLRLAGLRADKAVEYAEINAGRKLFQTQLDQLNYKVQANSILESLGRANSAARARFAANGVDYGSGAAYAVQKANVKAAYQNIGINNLSALAARVMGMEDATQILKAGYDSAFYEREAAIAGTETMLKAGGYAAKGGSLLGDVQLVKSGVDFAKTFPGA